MGLYTFGGGTADQTTDSATALSAGGVQLTVWDSRIGGSKVTSLFDMGGDPLPGFVTSAVSADPSVRGRVLFKASDGYSALFLWDGDPDHDRWGVLAIEVTTRIATAIAKADAAHTDVAALTSSLSALTAQVGRLPSKELDIATRSAVFSVELNAKTHNSVMQSAVKDYRTGQWYLAMVLADQDQDGKPESVISRIGADGTYIDSMILMNAGHGTKFGIQHVADDVYLWWGWDKAPTNPADGAAGDVVRFPYAAGTSATRDDATMVGMPKFGIPNAPEVGVDERADLVCYRQIGNPFDTYVLRSLADVLASIDRPLGTLQLDSATTVQGFAFDRTNFYLYHGTSGVPTNPPRLERWSWATGDQTADLDMSPYGLAPDGSAIGGHQEPESLELYTDPASGAQTLFAGMAVGYSGNRRNLIYAFTPVGGTDYSNDLLRSTVNNSPVVGVGRAREPSPAAMDMTGLTVPGWYFLDTTTFAAMTTDRPATAVAGAGWFLQVSGNGNVGRLEVTQTLTRSAIGPTQQQFWRVVRSDGIGQWSEVTATLVDYSAT